MALTLTGPTVHFVGRIRRIASPSGFRPTHPFLRFKHLMRFFDDILDRKAEIRE
ncbi:hypothetical protein CKO_00328 [Citrobacter koseri ATCC BAA-895]|uniref:Uncharacterized protein n=1 Tax=Citrobacter koseri (strain ATCC BAA-895 / CDC 4225-83 / SGSC4696) TaxID=290338 RepID=A8ADC8_CITK8|nr:hypothetical protein CKO_00328 [Citrobacter koseri ATCC BAA-895]